jgi:hypothetical protein
VVLLLPARAPVPFAPSSSRSVGSRRLVDAVGLAPPAAALDDEDTVGAGLSVSGAQSERADPWTLVDGVASNGIQPKPLR